MAIAPYIVITPTMAEEINRRFGLTIIMENEVGGRIEMGTPGDGVIEIISAQNKEAGCYMKTLINADGKISYAKFKDGPLKERGEVCKIDSVPQYLTKTDPHDAQFVIAMLFGPEEVGVKNPSFDKNEIESLRHKLGLDGGEPGYENVDPDKPLMLSSIHALFGTLMPFNRLARS